MFQLREIAFPDLEITDETWEDFASRFEYLTLPKKTTILQYGEVENYLHFLEKGIVRSFVNNGEGDKTLRFYFSGFFFNGFSSFAKRIPSDIEL